MKTIREKRFFIALVIWFFLALSILLAPAPREWGDFGTRINSFYDETRSVLQPATHIILMATGVFLLMGCLHRKTPKRAFFLSMGIAVSLAVLFELLQGFLPSSFARRCDAGDLVPSIAGMLLGGVAGFLPRIKNNKKDESN